jgi:hypothetical protein
MAYHCLRILGDGHEGLLDVRLQDDVQAVLINDKGQRSGGLCNEVRTWCVLGWDKAHNHTSSWRPRGAAPLLLAAAARTTSACSSIFGATPSAMQH